MTIETGFTIEMRERPTTLAKCPIGLFFKDGQLCVKTEYGNNEGRIDAYIVSSGEMFWGSQPQTIESQRAEKVWPAKLVKRPHQHEAAMDKVKCSIHPVDKTAVIFDGDEFSPHLTTNKVERETYKRKAALIVKAVNCHDQLVEALERAQEELRLINMKDTGAIYDVGLRTAINAALAAAKGEA